MARTDGDPKKPIPDDGKIVRKQSVAGEEDPGSSIGTSKDAGDQAPPPAHPDKRVLERDGHTRKPEK